MTKRFLHTVLSFAASLCASSVTTPPAHAQVNDIVRFELPCETLFGKSTLPAGKYIVSDLQHLSGVSVLTLSSESGKTVSAIFQRVASTGGRTTTQTHVDLVRHNQGLYQLDKIWVSGREYGYELLPN